MQSTIHFLVQASLALLVFSVGLQSRWQDLFHVIRQPALLLPGVFAVYLVTPAVMVALLLTLPVAPNTKAGLVAMAIAPMAPFLPGKMLKLGAERPFAIGLYVALMVVAIVVVPVSVWAVDQVTEREVSLPPGPLAQLVLTSVFLPLLAGIAIAALLPEQAARFSRVATIAVFVVVLPVLLLILFKSASDIVSLFGDGTLLAIGATVVVGMTVGHALAGSDPGNRLAMAQATVTRHPGIAALIINTNGIDRRAMLAVILFLFASVILSSVYGKLLARRKAPHAGTAEAVP